MATATYRYWIVDPNGQAGATLTYDVGADLAESFAAGVFGKVGSWLPHRAGPSVSFVRLPLRARERTQRWLCRQPIGGAA